MQPQLEKLGVVYLYPKTSLSEENLKAYLQTPPTGESDLYCRCTEMITGCAGMTGSFQVENNAS